MDCRLVGGFPKWAARVRGLFCCEAFADMGIVANKKGRCRCRGLLVGRARATVRLLSFAVLSASSFGILLWLLLSGNAVEERSPASAPPEMPAHAVVTPAAPRPAPDIPATRPPVAPPAKTTSRPVIASVSAPASRAAPSAEPLDDSPAAPPGDPDNPDLAVGFGQALSMLHSVELGDDPPPFPHFYADDEDGNEDFFVSETNVIVIGEKDTPADERRKEAIAWAKVDIGEYVRAGGRANDALSDIYAYQKECAKLRIDASDDFRAWLTGHPDEADEVFAALAEFNASLRKEGIKELSEEEIQPFDDNGEEQ